MSAIVLPLYAFGRSFCSEKSKDISSIVYLIPNRRQRQHSLISLRYVKLIANGRKEIVIVEGAIIGALLS